MRHEIVSANMREKANRRLDDALFHTFGSELRLHESTGHTKAGFGTRRTMRGKGWTSAEAAAVDGPCEA